MILDLIVSSPLAPSRADPGHVASFSPDDRWAPRPPGVAPSRRGARRVARVGIVMNPRVGPVEVETDEEQQRDQAGGEQHVTTPREKSAR